MQKVDIEEAHLREYKRFLEYWDEKMKEFDIENRQALEDLKEKQTNELDSYKSRLNGEKNPRCKLQTEIFNLKKIEVT
jgi:hypothetical protein